MAIPETGVATDVVANAEAGAPGARTTPARPGPAIVVVGTSAGGVSALQRLARALPAHLPAAVFVVIHLSAESHSQLPELLTRAGPLPAAWAEDGMPIVPGRILVAPADCHLLLEPDRVTVVRGPKENRHRPAIDPLFRSAAWAFGPRVTGVVLTGSLDDGTAGLWAIKSCGGTTVVQDPGDAEHSEMPSNALMHNRIDHRLPLADIAPLLMELASKAVTEPVAMPPERLKDEIEYTKMNHRDLRDMNSLGTLSPFTCPTCRGALWELEENGHLRYRCHTGHAYTHASLLIDQNTAIEEAMYAALRAVEEKAAALRRLSERWDDRFPVVKADYEQRAGEMDNTAEVLRNLLSGDAAE
jgi:two-component system chemotaxis response regulator CheB